MEALPEIAQRLLRVQIENDNAISVIRRYDSPETLFYCDPPYPHDSRGDTKAYKYEMSNEAHYRLADTLRAVQGKVALSSYHSPLMDELYGEWTYIEAPARIIHSIKQERIEVLWINYDIEEVSAWSSSFQLPQLFEESSMLDMAKDSSLRRVRH